MAVDLKKEFTLEEKPILTNKIYSEIIRRLVRAIEDNFGAKGREVIDLVLYMFGREVGEKIKNLLEIEGRGLSDYAKVHYYQDTNFWAIGSCEAY